MTLRSIAIQYPVSHLRPVSHLHCIDLHQLCRGMGNFCLASTTTWRFVATTHLEGTQGGLAKLLPTQATASVVADMSDTSK